MFLVTFLLLSIVLTANPARSEWIERSSGTTEHLRGGWVAPDDSLFAVGDGGTILHCDGSSCSSMTSGTTNPLFDVWGSASNNAAASGLNSVLRYNGTYWSSITPYTGVTFAPVWVSPNGVSIFVADSVGGWYTLNRYDTNLSKWNDFSYLLTSRVLAFGGSDNDVTIVLATGDIKHTDNSWNVTDVHAHGVSLNLQAAWINPADSNEAFAADVNSTMYRFNGSSWVDMSAGIPATTDIWGITGTSRTDVYAAGKNGSNQGVVYHFDGIAWNLENIPSVNGLIDVAIGSVWCIGELGDIIAFLSESGTSSPPCVRQISAGPYTSMVIGQDGTLWTWGLNKHGQLGDGTNSCKNTPTQVGTDTDWNMISAGWAHMTALKNDGTLWAWGENSNGSVGDGTNTHRYIPTQVGTDTDWKLVAAGMAHTIAIKNDGTLWTWGYNYYGQLGDGTNSNKNTPVQIGTGTDWATVAAGESHTIAIKNDGTLWAWGGNYFGQLGDGTESHKNTPTQIGTDTDWEMVAVGETHTIAIKKDGTLCAWGLNNSGQLGDGTNSGKNTPTKIGSSNNWKNVSAGARHTVATREDGSYWAWGSNCYGQLGDGITTSQNTPTRMNIAANGGTPAAGGYRTMIGTADFALWTMGNNTYGQLGDGPGLRDYPVQIIKPCSSPWILFQSAILSGIAKENK